MNSKKILTFGASNSRKSINKQLAFYTAGLINEADIVKIDLNDFEMPFFSVDREVEEGIPEKAYAFRDLVESSDGIIISFAEHNGAYTAIFKNIFDWISRIKGSAWGDKPMLLMATSPGVRGGKTVLEIATKRFPWNGGEVAATFSLPNFNDNFDLLEGIVNDEFLDELKKKIQIFEKAMEAKKAAFEGIAT